INKVKEAVGMSNPEDNPTVTATDSSYGPGGSSTHRSNPAQHGTTTTHDAPEQSRIGGAAEHNTGGKQSLTAKLTDPRGGYDDTTKPTRTGYGSQHVGGTGSTTTAGPHRSDAANKLDPRVDSDRDNRGAHGTTGGAFG